MRQRNTHYSTFLLIGISLLVSVSVYGQTPTPTIECLNTGDVIGDGVITAGDAQNAFYIVLGIVTPTTEQACAADCNGDQEVTAGDAQHIFLVVMGLAACVDPLITSTPSNTPTHTNPPTSTPTFTPTRTPTATPTSSGTSTMTPTRTPTITPTPTPNPTQTPTPEPTETPYPYDPGDIVSSDAIVGNMRYVPPSGPGGFQQGAPADEPCSMGEEHSPFTHIITRHVAVMELEITRLMWDDLDAAQPTLPDDPSNTSVSPGGSNPVNRSTWYEAVLFANLLSIQNGYTRCYYTDAGFTNPITSSNYTTGPFYCNFDANGYRLPFEGEWEYFTRAGTTGCFSCDVSNYTSGTCSTAGCTSGFFASLELHCAFCANACVGVDCVSFPAGSLAPNPWNLKDVHGNVWEWTWNVYESTYPAGPVTDYTGLDTGTYRSFRGGGCFSESRWCRSATRNCNTPQTRNENLGFRLVRTLN